MMIYKRKKRYFKIIFVYCVALLSFIICTYIFDYRGKTNEAEKTNSEYSRESVVIRDHIFFRKQKDKFFFKPTQMDYNFEKTILSICLGSIITHYLWFVLYPKFYVKKSLFICSVIFIFYPLIFKNFNFETSTFYVAFIFSSLFTYALGNLDLETYSKLLRNTITVFFFNFHILIFGILFPVIACGFILFLYFFRVSFNLPMLIRVFNFFVVFWTVKITISFVEVLTNSTVVFYIINQGLDTNLFVFIYTFKNVYYCLGSIILCKFCFFFQNTCSFISREIEDFEGFFLFMFKVIINLPVYILRDISSLFFQEQTFYHLSYVSMFNCSQLTALREVYNILYNRMWITRFGDIYFRYVHYQILVIILYISYPVVNDYLIHMGFILEEYKMYVILYVCIMAIYIFYVFYIIFYTIIISHNLMFVLFPSLFYSHDRNLFKSLYLFGTRSNP